MAPPTSPCPPDATVTTPPVFTVLRPAPPPARRYRSRRCPPSARSAPRTVRRRARAEPSAPELPAFAEPDEK